MVHLTQGSHVGVKCLSTLTGGDVLKEVKFFPGELWDWECFSVHGMSVNLTIT